MSAVQTKGLVGVHYDTAKPGEKAIHTGLDFVSKTMAFSASMPIRYSAIHMCFKEGSGNPVMKNFFLGAALKSAPQYSRARTAVHQGSDQEIQYQLRKHGFPDSFPVDSNGNIRRNILNVWFHLHMANEPSYVNTFNRVMVQEEREDADSVDSTSSTEEKKIEGREESTAKVLGNDQEGSSQDDDSKQAPRPDHDVFLGRGKDVQNYRGNIQFREYLAAFHHEYDAAPRHQRGKVAAELTKAFKAQGIRFFQRNAAKEWVECGSHVIKTKVSQLLREFRKKKNAAW
mmetsp:Transcript_30001/g.72041  ORF Transcript_30001/g.72041 Transcript_30001/m.72041 type:complete len:286 (+) Transcript_30001:100-957(+)